jgi:hypothetical protein
MLCRSRIGLWPRPAEHRRVAYDTLDAGLQPRRVDNSNHPQHFVIFEICASHSLTSSLESVLGRSDDNEPADGRLRLSAPG